MFPFAMLTYQAIVHILVVQIINDVKRIKAVN